MKDEPDVAESLSRFAERIRSRIGIEGVTEPLGEHDVVEVHIMDPSQSGSVEAFLMESSPQDDRAVSILAVPVTELGPAPVESLRAAFASIGCEPTFIGMAPSPTGPADATHVVAVQCDHITRRRSPAPPDFSVTAIVTAFNEADIIRPTVDWLLAQGIEVVVIDNWSTDGTVDRIQHLVDAGRIRVVKFPADGPTEFFQWTALLERVTEVAAESGSDWVVHNDSDQRHDSPWVDLNFRDALYTVDRLGYTAVDHTVIDFRPTDNSFCPGTELTDHFRHFEFDEGSSTDVHIQAWRNDQIADLTRSGGHDVAIEGRRVFPFNFTIRHYQVRSQTHGEQKVYRDRKPRYLVDELDRGWHDQYFRISRRHQFVRDPSSLLEYRPRQFEDDYLLQRLAQVGIRETGPARTRFRGPRSAAVQMLRRAGLLSRFVRIRNRLRTARR